jgi:large subunit ribosomal protein L30
MPKKSASAAKTTKTVKKSKPAKAAKTTKTAKTTKAVKAMKATKATKATKTPKATTAAARSTKVRVQQVRSGIGRAATYRRTLRALGLRHHQQEVVLPDSPSVRGMLFKVRHLVRVTPEEA